jgi:predicted phage terminase large subunit-like protein
MSAATIRSPLRTTATPPTKIISPQPGFQARVLACPADILITGGGAGPGKTFALLLEAIRHHRVPQFNATIFRRTSPEITNPGGLWDESWGLYPALGGQSNENDLSWTFASGASVKFAHLQHEKDKYNYDGAQIPLIGFDQLEHFTESQFWFMWSRNRSVCGVRPYIRASANPVPSDDPTGGWLHTLIQWWIHPDTGFIRPDRDGVLRWFIRDNNELIWGDSRAELLGQFPHVKPEHILSFTFIEGKLDENVILKQKDPAYEAKLRALPQYQRDRLLHRNWNARPTAGMVFNRAWFQIVDAAPAQLITARYWDKAATESGGCYTAGVKMGRDNRTGLFYVLDVVRWQWSSGHREQVIRQVAQLDGHDTRIYTEQEPGSGGKESAANTVINLAGFTAYADPVRGDKMKRAEPLSAYAEAGNVRLVRGQWNASYLEELHNFAPDAGVVKDQVDASSGCFNKLSMYGQALTISCDGHTLGDPIELENPVLAAIRNQGCYWPESR